MTDQNNSTKKKEMYVTWCFKPSQPVRLYQGDQAKGRKSGFDEYCLPFSSEVITLFLGKDIDSVYKLIFNSTVTGPGCDQ